jgi:hypothetical protein
VPYIIASDKTGVINKSFIENSKREFIPNQELYSQAMIDIHRSEGVIGIVQT